MRQGFVKLTILGIGVRLTFAFFTVIMIAVLGNAGYSLFLEYQTSRNEAAARNFRCQEKVGHDFGLVEEANYKVAEVALQDTAVVGAFNSKDKAAMGAALKSVIAKTGLIGYISVVEGSGNVLYSTDTPAKAGYSAKERSKGVAYVLSHNERYLGVACFTPTNALVLASMYPIKAADHVVGVMIVSQPLNSEFLTGLVTKFALESDHLTGVDLALLSMREGRLVANTPNLMNPQTAGPYFTDLEHRGMEAVRPNAFTGFMVSFLHLPHFGYEAGGRWWTRADLTDNPLAPNGTTRKEDIAGVLMITTPVPDFGARLASILLLGAVCGIVSFLFGLLFTMGISKGVNEPLRFLIDRTNDLASQKTVLPPIEGLSGDWLELAELIDTAVSSMRTSVQGLKLQLTRQLEEVQVRSKHADDTGVQLEQLNRQFSMQSKQLTEVSKQINNANQQSVLLQHKLDAVLQVSTEGFLILDQFGNILSANPIFLNWVGCSEGEIAGRLCFDLVKRPGEPPNAARDGKAFARHSGNPNELINQFYPEGTIYHRSQEKKVDVLAHLQPVVSQDSAVHAYIMVLRDKSLRSEIAQLRSEIVAMLSESIRVPLATAEQQWMYILTNAAQLMHPSVGQPLAELHNHYGQLLGLVDSLLMMYGGIVPPSVAPRMNIVVTRLVAECLEMVAPMARERQLALDYKSVTGLPNITGNRDAAKDILLQTLEKMIGVTAPGGRVRVESSARQSEMRIAVTSSGPALQQTEIADMFSGFIEGKHAESTYSSRLSMYLVRNNVERIGGKIWAESDGRGTAILFTLPMQ